MRGLRGSRAHARWDAGCSVATAEVSSTVEQGDSGAAMAGWNSVVPRSMGVHARRPGDDGVATVATRWCGVPRQGSGHLGAERRGGRGGAVPWSSRNGVVVGLAMDRQEVY